MAFGKVPANLSNVGSFRQRSHTFNQDRAKSKQRRGGAAPIWVNQYRPSTLEADNIRLLQGNYTVEDVDTKGNLVKVNNLSFYPYVEHYDSRQSTTSKYCVCSAGPYRNDKRRANPCHGCQLFWESMKTNPSTGKREKGFMGKRDMVAFSVLDYFKYHKVEQVDFRTGAVRMNQEGVPYYNWVRCQKNAEGRGPCDSCGQKKETKEGHRVHWSMGTDHYNALLSKDEDVGKACTVCSQIDVIRNEAWLCPNKECGEAVIDDNTNLSQKEINEIVYSPCRCSRCSNIGYLEEVISCLNCTPQGRDPKRATIFDVDLKIRRVEATDSSNRTSLDIVSFSPPRPIPKGLIELAKPEDLARIYAPTALEQQAQRFHIRDNSPTRTPVTASRPYSAPEEDAGPGFSEPSDGSSDIPY